MRGAQILGEAILFAFLSLLPQHVFGDMLILNSGEQIEGKIVAETATKIGIEPSKPAGPVRLINKTDIRTVQRDSSKGSDQNSKTTPVQSSKDQNVAGFSTELAGANTVPITFSGSAFDLLLLLGKERHLPLSIDPEILPELAKTSISIATPSKASAVELIDAHLKPK